jgi:DUF971 family protein
MNAQDERPSSGLSPHTPRPTEITVRSVSRLLEIVFDDGRTFRLPFEFLRVFSPSAEVRGHGPGQETLQVGKRDVTIQSLDAVGHYAVQPIFSDGHDSGLYSWDYLYELGINQDAMWADYLQRLEAAGASRDPSPGGDKATAGGCGDRPAGTGDPLAVNRCGARAGGVREVRRDTGAGVRVDKGAGEDPAARRR